MFATGPIMATHSKLHFPTNISFLWCHRKHLLSRTLNCWNIKRSNLKMHYQKWAWKWVWLSPQNPGILHAGDQMSLEKLTKKMAFLFSLGNMQSTISISKEEEVHTYIQQQEATCDRLGQYPPTFVAGDSSFSISIREATFSTILG